MKDIFKNVRHIKGTDIILVDILQDFQWKASPMVYGLLLSTPEIKYFTLFYLNKWTSWNWSDSIRRGSSLIMKLFITKKFGTFLIKTTFSLLFWGHWRQGLSSFLLSLGTVVSAPCLSPSELLTLKGTWPCLFVSFFAGNFLALSSFSPL